MKKLQSNKVVLVSVVLVITFGCGLLSSLISPEPEVAPEEAPVEAAPTVEAPTEEPTAKPTIEPAATQAPPL